MNKAPRVFFIKSFLVTFFDDNLAEGGLMSPARRIKSDKEKKRGHYGQTLVRVDAQS